MNQINEDTQAIGEKFKPLLAIMENALWEYECANSSVPGFDDDSFRSIIKLFAAALLERVWQLQERESLCDEDRINMALAAASELKKLIKTYTDIDTEGLYADELND